MSALKPPLCTLVSKLSLTVIKGVVRPGTAVLLYTPNLASGLIWSASNKIAKLPDPFWVIVPILKSPVEVGLSALKTVENLPGSAFTAINPWPDCPIWTEPIPLNASLLPKFISEARILLNSLPDLNSISFEEEFIVNLACYIELESSVLPL